ncbi:MAG: restriction endonuclease subunit S [Thermoleophilia bacterium]
MTHEIAAGWRRARLGDHVELVAGFAFRSSEFSTSEVDVRLLRGDNVGQGHLRWAGVKRWPVERSPEVQRYRLEIDDVVLAMDRPWIEAGLKYARVREHDLPCFLVQRVARLRAGDGVITQEFLPYLIGSPQFTQHVLSVQTGTAVPHISGAQILSYMLSVPPRGEQAAIVNILAALDDKIESNRRLALLLDEAAATLFRARFVDYLGDTDLIESVMGRIPREWSTGYLGDIACESKTSTRPFDRPDALFEHFSIPAFDAGARPEVVRGEEIRSAKTKLPEEPNLLLSKLNPATKRVWRPTPRGQGEPVCSPEFIVLVPLDETPLSYLDGLLMADTAFYGRLLGYATGTTGSRQRVKSGDVLGIPLVIPPTAERLAFGEIASPLLAHADRLRNESCTLSDLRDALLPKLVSGQMRVPDAEDLVAAN